MSVWTYAGSMTALYDTWCCHMSYVVIFEIFLANNVFSSNRAPGFHQRFAALPNCLREDLMHR